VDDEPPPEKPPSRKDLYARLSRDPWRLSFAQIARLTDEQIFDVLCRQLPEDEEGGGSGGEGGGDLAATINAMRAEQGLPPAEFYETNPA
jgi:hypothetical protein